MVGRFRLKGDKVIWLLVVFFAMISIVAVFSSSSYLANARGVDKTAIFVEQTRSVLLGFLALFICYLIPLKWYRLLAFPVFGISVIGLIMLYIPPFQDIKNGAVRGLKLFGHTFQVFELAKIGIILYLAKALEIWGDRLNDKKEFAIKIFLPIALVCALVLKNSFSSTVLIGMVCYLVLILMKVDWKNILLSFLVVVAVGAFLFLIYKSFYSGKPKEEIPGLFNRFPTIEARFERFHKDEAAVADMSEEAKKMAEDENRQKNNALVAISEGKVIGKGPGKSTQRYSLSMAFSDFIFAFIVEEYGLLGGTVVILLYLIFFFRCMRITVKCTKMFSNALITGLAFLITIQAFLHIMVNVGFLPVTGHTLPLISHGGTAYLILSGAFGIILSVSKQLDKQYEQALAEDTISETDE